MTNQKKYDIVILINAKTKRSNMGFRFQRVRAGESRITEPMRITLPSSNPKNVKNLRIFAFSRCDVIRPLQRTRVIAFALDMCHKR